MRRRTRQYLFVVAVLIFCAASFLAIRYGQGYVWDWTTNTFVRTGAISVGVNTEGAQLYIDDNLVGSTSLLSRSVGANRITPGTHTVRLVKNGWSSWRKTATVVDGRLTEFPAALLVSLDDDATAQLHEEASRSLAFAHTTARVAANGFMLRGGQLFDLAAVASTSPLASNVLGFSPVSNRSRVLWWTRNELWVLWIRAINDQPARVAGERLLLARFSTGIARAAWFRDQAHIVVDLGGNSYRIIETDTRGGINTIRL